LTLSRNTKLTTVSALGARKLSALTIEHNPVLTSLAGLSTVNHVDGTVSIGWNVTLPSLAGFDNLVQIDGSVRVYGDTALASIGMPKLVAVTGSVFFAADPALSADDIAAFKARVGK
jgi:hypothetical protein